MTIFIFIVIILLQAVEYKCCTFDATLCIESVFLFCMTLTYKLAQCHAIVTVYVLICYYCNLIACDCPCQNGGTCSSPGNCACTSGWTGRCCETRESSAHIHAKQ